MQVTRSDLLEICKILSFFSISDETLQYIHRKFFVKSLEILLGEFPVILSQGNCLNFITIFMLILVVKSLLLQT